MAAIYAYLDDYGKITVWMNRNFYNGKSDSFTLLGAHGAANKLVITGIEEHETNFRYDMTAPADMEFGVDYLVREQHGMTVPLVFRLITHSEQFNKQFKYDGNDLGAVYGVLHTDFAVWAPTAVDVILRVTVDEEPKTYTMKRSEKGVWRVRVMGDLKHATYVYLLKRNGKYVESLDPYAYSSTGNSRESAVIDLNELERTPKVNVEGSVSGTDAIIYEMSVRDVTASPLTGTLSHGTFNALCEENTKFHDRPTGLNYISSLGVTHVQLMPVLDFATLDEFHPLDSYNWGYDPVQFLSIDGGFASNPDDPYVRMKELRSLVAKLHEHQLRVNLDVVFNHLYDVDTSPFNQTVPYYYFRYNNSGFLSNGSYCGNDFATNQPMAERYLVHVIQSLMKLYDVDGFRFDLMGILDVDTMNAIRRAALEIKEDAMIYGEGWDMPTQLDWNKKACLTNQDKMPGIGHFNDFFRDVIKGKTSDDQKYEQGYATGDMNRAYDVLSALSANVLTDPYFMRFSDPAKSINGLETHDNGTVWDKMHFCCQNEAHDARKARQKMMIAMTLVAQGVPFLHAGIEFCDTKNDNSNSYNAGDSINQMDWQRAEFNADVIEYTRRAIALRRKYKAFRFHKTEQIARCLRLSVAEGGTVFYDIDYSDKDTKTSLIRVLINPSYEEKQFYYEPGWQVVFDENGECREEKTDHIVVPGLSLVVCVR
jgi:pullulanase